VEEGFRIGSKFGSVKHRTSVFERRTSAKQQRLLVVYEPEFTAICKRKSDLRPYGEMGAVVG
jgi:hypothetical protein